MKKREIDKEASNLSRALNEFNIQRERKGQQGWRKKDLAEAIGVTPGYISNLMSGSRIIPLDRALEIATLFCIKLDDLSPRLAFELRMVADAIPASEHTVTQDVVVVRVVKDFIKAAKSGKKLTITEETECMHWPGEHSPNTYAIPVTGQAMYPELPDGSQAIVDCDKKDNPTVGSTILYADKGRLAFAKYNGDRHVELINKKYKDNVFRLPERASILGQVVGRMIID